MSVSFSEICYWSGSGEHYWLSKINLHTTALCQMILLLSLRPSLSATEQWQEAVEVEELKELFFFFFAGSFTCLATGQTGQTNTTPQKAQRAREWVPPAPATTNSAELHREFLAESCLLSVSYPPLQHCCSWTKKNTPKRCPCKCKWLTVKCVFILARVIWQAWN